MASQRFVDWNAAWIMGRISNMSTFGKDVVMKDATGLTSAQDMRRGNYRHAFLLWKKPPKSVKVNNGV